MAWKGHRLLFFFATSSFILATSFFPCTIFFLLRLLFFFHPRLFFFHPRVLFPVLSVLRAQITFAVSKQYGDGKRWSDRQGNDL